MFPNLKLLTFNSKQILLQTNSSWAICLQSHYLKPNYYSLPTNFLNQQKLVKLLPNYPFPKIKFPPLPKPPLLRNYQKADVKFLSSLTSIAILSEMRTGKTPIALSIFKKWPVTNLLIITPGILQNQWGQAVETWLQKPVYLITHLSQTDRHTFYQKILQEEDWIVIVSKDTFKLDSSYWQKLKRRKASNQPYTVIIDEAHFLRNYQSQQSRAIYALKDAPYKMVLTGTPMVNHPTDIFGILKFLYPQEYSAYWPFVEKYFAIDKFDYNKGFLSFPIRKVKDFASEEKRTELQQLLAQFSVNRRQQEVLPWLPRIIYQTEYLLMSEEQQKIYNLWQEKWRTYQPLEILAKLKTLSLYPPTLGLKTEGCKINFLLSWLAEWKNQSVIIFSTRSETFLEPLFEKFQAKKIPAGLITGNVNNQLKNQAINQFQTGKIKVLLANIQSANVGLNLSQAETIIFADRSYSPADNEQAEARFLPTEQEKQPRPRLIIDLIARGTIDEKILRLLKKKEDIMGVLREKAEKVLG